ncbi:hypothetical protein N3K66_002642 [Trichothecium roseum]|uniref:Uncharacterized protein n=1 Tax=Trichothecium roseum TaxID=47278 RepID=A0ACC0VC48_9HYPO|nr:hypothetical protein N3K66_002642 [Trichothecium roseum]
MPPKQAADGDTPAALNASELRFIKAVFDNMTQKPDADWDRVASDLSLKDAKCAKERFRQMSVRHGWRGDSASSPRKGGGGKGGGGGSGAARKTAGRVAKKAAAPRKKKVKVEDEDEDEGAEEKPKSDEDFDSGAF